LTVAKENINESDFTQTTHDFKNKHSHRQKKLFLMCTYVSL